LKARISNSGAQSIGEAQDPSGTPQIPILQMKNSDLVSIATFRSPVDAQIAKGILDEVGIESMIRADNAGGMYPAISGAELLVRSEDAHKASEALHRRHRIN
jgi:hypothetical protein